MNDPEPNDLLWRGLRGELSDEEKNRLESLISSDARLKSEWEEELALNELLAKAPDAPVSTNFTSLVMQAVAKERREAAHKTSTFRWLRFGFARVTAGLAVVLVIGLGLHNRYEKSQRTELAAGLRDLTTVASVLDQKHSAVETLQDFEAIQKLSRVPGSSELDMELLLALQK
jgi:anti-sigma factor RsiW